MGSFECYFDERCILGLAAGLELREDLPDLGHVAHLLDDARVGREHALRGLGTVLVEVDRGDHGVLVELVARLGLQDAADVGPPIVRALHAVVGGEDEDEPEGRLVRGAVHAVVGRLVDPAGERPEVLALLLALLLLHLLGAALVLELLEEQAVLLLDLVDGLTREGARRLLADGDGGGRLLAVLVSLRDLEDQVVLRDLHDDRGRGVQVADDVSRVGIHLPVVGAEAVLGDDRLALLVRDRDQVRAVGLDLRAREVLDLAEPELLAGLEPLGALLQEGGVGGVALEDDELLVGLLLALRVVAALVLAHGVPPV